VPSQLSSSSMSFMMKMTRRRTRTWSQRTNRILGVLLPTKKIFGRRKSLTEVSQVGECPGERLWGIRSVCFRGGGEVGKGVEGGDGAHG
jgi:hypothetical protein